MEKVARGPALAYSVPAFPVDPPENWEKENWASQFPHGNSFGKAKQTFVSLAKEKTTSGCPTMCFVVSVFCPTPSF